MNYSSSHVLLSEAAFATQNGAMLREDQGHPQLPDKPKKKRVRRQKLELEYLRQLVTKLEEQLTQLQATPPPPPTVENKTASAKTEISVWKGVAERQLNERARVEEKNKKLRASLKGQLKLATKLEGLLRKRPRDEEVIALAYSKPLIDHAICLTDDEIFADQLAHVERAHLDVDRLFSRPEFLQSTASFSKLQVINDPHSDAGVAFIKTARSMLPFDVQVTEKAFWRAVAEEGTKKDSYFLEERLSTDTVVARSYGLHFNAGPFHANVLGKQTHRKCVVGDQVVIMWKWVVTPAELNGAKFSGVRCHETGWIVLRGVNLDCSGTTSTLLRSYSRMTMELQDDIANQQLQVGAITDFVVNLHDTLTEVTGKKIANILVEEDWHLNGWLGSSVTL